MKKRTITLWGLFSAFLLAIPIGVWIQEQKTAKHELPVFSRLAEFELIDQEGKPYSSREMKGQVVVANFIFTSCSSACPRLTEKMVLLQKRLQDQEIQDVQLLSITVDPDRDDPPTLKEYANAYGVDFDNWKFLTGDSQEIEKTIMKGFKVSVGKTEPQEPGHIFDIIHGDRFVILDQEQQIRAYFDVLENEIDQLLAHLKHLKNSPPILAQK